MTHVRGVFIEANLHILRKRPEVNKTSEKVLNAQ